MISIVIQERAGVGRYAIQKNSFTAVGVITSLVSFFMLRVIRNQMEREIWERRVVFRKVGSG